MKLSVVFVAIFSLLAGLSEGCSCPGPLTPQEEYCQASFVALGRFRRFNPRSGVAKFKITRRFKGIPDDERIISVVVGTGAISCDLDGSSFVKGERYLLAGSTSTDGVYSVNSGCGYFARLWSAIQIPIRRQWFRFYRQGEARVCNIDPCATVRCAAGTTCEVNDQGAAECIPDDRIDDPCSLVRCPADTTCEVDGEGSATCVSINPCALVRCLPGTTCQVNDEGNAECIPNTPPTTCPDNCASYFDGCNTCGCEEGQITFCTELFCEPEAYEKPYCIQEVEDACSPNPCKFAGQCSYRKDLESGFECECAEGYIGPTCEQKPPPTTCPKDCASYFDGCNTCACENGQLTFCTRRACEPAELEEPYCIEKIPSCDTDQDPDCLPPATCPYNCITWDNGCQRCACNEGVVEGCTDWQCVQQHAPFCVDFGDDPVL